MKRSEINELMRDAERCFADHGWTLPPRPRWDITDFGLGDLRTFGLVLVNLSNQPEYCEKLMYAKAGMTTPCHCHACKKEDVICRHGVLEVTLWTARPDESDGESFDVRINDEPRTLISGRPFVLESGERVTIPPRVYHEFRPKSAECILGEVSTANDDVNDNFFVDPRVGRFPTIVEDEPPREKLVSDR